MNIFLGILAVILFIFMLAENTNADDKANCRRCFIATIIAMVVRNLIMMVL